MNESVFTKIIRGEIPSHKIYEDQHTFVFLDITPAGPGHMLVVPKKQIDRLEDLPQPDYLALMQILKKVMQKVVEVFGPEYRACLKLEGFDVAHAHIHVIPCRTAEDFKAPGRPAAAADLAKMAQKLAF